MRQARNCWPVLVRKAQDAVNEAQNDIVQSLARVDQLEASHQRLCKLYDEYRLQEHASQAPVMGMQASMNHRQFMAQLLNLQHRVVLDLGKAQATLVQMRKKRLQAEIELHKMQSLAEQDAKAVAQEAKRYEQKQMDELGVRQFILGMSS
ncbi:flagellar FliJ family protein [uncultured Limnohabitans sp.]|jgi:flagellar export protein FliJ|uniref:flagellar FliJ family protein n=1 Tax=uncultured Limnohabitans sp. TaxID=768543 RepID=UPI002632E33A|nr:flagellar FliJ family protein [uncultured Limnohabitans sp.]